MSKSQRQILLVEDNDSHAELILRAFQPKRASVLIRVHTLAQARETIRECLPDLVIADLTLPDGNGLELLPTNQEEARYPIMFMTSHRDEKIAKKAIKSGALDYAVKSSATLQDMPKLAERALREWSLIVEHKQVTEALHHSEQQLRQAQKMEVIGTLAGGIAHDFNNILMAILGFTELSLAQITADHPNYRNLVEVMKASQRGKHLVEQILTFSHQTSEERKPVRLHLIVDEVLQLIRATLPSTIEVRKSIFSETGTALADPTQAYQVLLNLCANAEYAMRNNGGILEIGLQETIIGQEMIERYPLLQSGPHLELSVRDTGQGMSPEVLNRIVDPFFTTKEVGVGTGLGLSMVHRIVTNHGGALSVKSEVGKGTTVIVYFPQVSSVVEKPVHREISSPMTEGGHILFVDDEEPLLLLSMETLKLFGYEVTARRSSLEALEEFRRSPDKYDAVITDQTMPNMAGERLASELLKIRSDIPIILCTGFSHTITPERAASLGIRAFLLKPVPPQEMARVLMEVLHNQRKSISAKLTG